jgi:hypothetical protein
MFLKTKMFHKFVVRNSVILGMTVSSFSYYFRAQKISTLSYFKSA